MDIQELIEGARRPSTKSVEDPDSFGYYSYLVLVQMHQNPDEGIEVYAERPHPHSPIRIGWRGMIHTLSTVAITAGVYGFSWNREQWEGDLLAALSHGRPVTKLDADGEPLNEEASTAS